MNPLEISPEAALLLFVTAVVCLLVGYIGGARFGNAVGRREAMQEIEWILRKGGSK